MARALHLSLTMTYKFPLALGALGALAIWAPHAAACQPPMEYAASVPPAIPEGGYILGRVDCDSCVPADLVFKDGDTAIAGELLPAAGSTDAKMFVFVPETPLVEGQFINITSNQGLEPAQVEVKAAAGDLSVAAELSGRAQPAGNEATCLTPPGLCSNLTFSDKTETLAALYPSITNASQVYWKFDFKSGSDVSTQGDLLTHEIGLHTFEGTPAEVCLTPTWYDPMDGTPHELAEICEETSALNLGVADVPYGDMSSLVSCEAPPTGFESEWCDALADVISCDSKVPEERCTNYAATCSDIGAGGAGGAGGENSGGAAPSGGASTGGKGPGTGGKDPGTGGTKEPTGGSDPGEPGTDTSGCSCSVGPTRSSSSFMGMMGLLAFGGLFIFRSRKSARA